MNHFMGLLLSFILFSTSCSEGFNHRNPTEFNRMIEHRVDIQTAEQLIKIYYDYPEAENNLNLAITNKELNNGLIEVTLIHDNQKDDSQKGTKIIMTAELKEKKWIVHKIKANRKCYSGRGHTGWGAAKCY